MAFRRRERRTELSKLDATPPWETRKHDEPEPTTGPFDLRDAPEDDLTRIDLGALRLPLQPGAEIRLDVNEAQQIVFATMISSDGQMQIGLFAAPRSENIWDDVRAEIASSLIEQGGTAKETDDGPYGSEVVGTLISPEGQAPVRFLGVQGPRWFLRAMIVGEAAADSAKGAAFAQAFGNVIVVRGSEPMPAREPILLTLPKEVASAEQPDQV